MAYGKHCLDDQRTSKKVNFTVFGRQIVTHTYSQTNCITRKRTPFSSLSPCNSGSNIRRKKSNGSSILVLAGSVCSHHRIIENSWKHTMLSLIYFCIEISMRIMHFQVPSKCVDIVMLLNAHATDLLVCNVCVVHQQHVSLLTIERLLGIFPFRGEYHIFQLEKISQSLLNIFVKIRCE